MQSTNSDKPVERVTVGRITLCIRRQPSTTVIETKPRVILRIKENKQATIETLETKIDTDVSNTTLILEEWREVGVEYPGYFVSTRGRIRGLKGKIFNGKPNARTGYVLCWIKKSTGQDVSMSVHILVARTFIPNPDNRPVVNHINGNRCDNQVNNLNWATHSENSGCMKLNKISPDNTRKVAQFDTDGQLTKVWDSLIEAAASIQANYKTMSRICRNNSIYCGYKWKYVDTDEIEGEEWRSVFFNSTIIQASNWGRIKSDKGRIIGSDGDGYLRVAIKGHKACVHRLVCQAWKPIENPEMFMVNHIDNNGLNNRIENLEWVTSSGNVSHYHDNFSVKEYINYGRPVRQLSLDGVTKNSIFGSAKEASKVTGVNASSITRVCRGKGKSAGGYVWKYVEVNQMDYPTSSNALVTPR